MADFEINFLSIKQTTNTSPTCKVQINFQVTGPHTSIDLVQVYAVNSVDTAPNGLGDVVDTVDLTITEFQYTSQPDLPAGSAFTIALCPRSKTGDTLDDQIDGQYWESYCVYQPFTTQLTPGIGAPQVSVSSIEPATLNHPNEITIAWSGDNYTDGQVLWGTLKTPRQNVIPFQPTDQGNEPNYNGQYTANIPSALQGQILSFTVQVRNSFNDATLWYPTTIGVLSARNYRSLRQFLQASGVNFPASIRQILKTGHSIRALMQI